LYFIPALAAPPQRLYPLNPLPKENEIPPALNEWLKEIYHTLERIFADG